MWDTYRSKYDDTHHSLTHRVLGFVCSNSCAHPFSLKMDCGQWLSHVWEQWADQSKPSQRSSKQRKQIICPWRTGAEIRFIHFPFTQGCFTSSVHIHLPVRWSLGCTGRKPCRQQCTVPPLSVRYWEVLAPDTNPNLLLMTESQHTSVDSNHSSAQKGFKSIFQLSGGTTWWEYIFKGLENLSIWIFLWLIHEDFQSRQL